MVMILSVTGYRSDIGLNVGVIDSDGLNDLNDLNGLNEMVQTVQNVQIVQEVLGETTEIGVDR
jgi:hypothetical protein